MTEHLLLSSGDSKGIIPGQLQDVGPGPSQSITPVLLQDITSVPYKELPPVDQDMVMAMEAKAIKNSQERHAAIVTEDTIPATNPKLGPPFTTLYEDLQSAIRNQSQSEQKWLHSLDEFEQKEVCQWKVYESRVAQKKAEFMNNQATKKAHLQIDQKEKQERFQYEHLSLEFKSEQWKQCHLFEASRVEEEERFQAEDTQRRLQHRKQIDEESQKSLVNHIQVVGETVGKATPPVILQLTAGLLATWGATVPVPIPVYQPPTSVQSMRMPQNSSGEPNATQQAVKSGGSSSISNQPYIYKHSDSTKDSGLELLWKHSHLKLP